MKRVLRARLLPEEGQPAATSAGNGTHECKFWGLYGSLSTLIIRSEQLEEELSPDTPVRCIAEQMTGTDRTLPGGSRQGKPAERRGRKATRLPQRYAATLVGPPNDRQGGIFMVDPVLAFPILWAGTRLIWKFLDLAGSALNTWMTTQSAVRIEQLCSAVRMGELKLESARANSPTREVSATSEPPRLPPGHRQADSSASSSSSSHRLA